MAFLTSLVSYLEDILAPHEGWQQLEDDTGDSNDSESSSSNVLKEEASPPHELLLMAAKRARLSASGVDEGSQTSSSASPRDHVEETTASVPMVAPAEKPKLSCLSGLYHCSQNGLAYTAMECFLASRPAAKAWPRWLDSGSRGCIDFSPTYFIGSSDDYVHGGGDAGRERDRNKELSLLPERMHVSYLCPRGLMIMRFMTLRFSSLTTEDQVAELFTEGGSLTAPSLPPVAPAQVTCTSRGPITAAMAHMGRVIAAIGGVGDVTWRLTVRATYVKISDDNTRVRGSLFIHRNAPGDRTHRAGQARAEEEEITQYVPAPFSPSSTVFFFLSLSLSYRPSRVSN